MTYTVEIPAQAYATIEELEEWWLDNRHAAPDRISDELDRVVSLLEVTPRVGAVYTRIGRRVVRRIRLRTTPYHVYYSVNEQRRQVDIAAVWPSMCREGPPL